jgi:hypothetical protein
MQDAVTQLFASFHLAIEKFTWTCTNHGDALTGRTTAAAGGFSAEGRSFTEQGMARSSSRDGEAD